VTAGQQIAGFRSELASVNGVRLHYWIGGDANGPPVFYRGDAVAQHEAISLETVNEYLRTFAGLEGVLGSLGVYRTAFATMAQTLPLTQNPVQLLVVAIGGEKGLGARVGQFVSMAAANVESVVLPHCGHFVPEECPEAILEQLDRLNDADGVTKSMRRSFAVK
jgi:hypothetical protein